MAESNVPATFLSKLKHRIGEITITDALVGASATTTALGVSRAIAAKDRGNLVRAKIWTAYAGWQAVATGVNIAASVLERKGAVEDHPLFKIQEKMYPALAGKYMFIKDHPLFPGGTNRPRGL